MSIKLFRSEVRGQSKVHHQWGAECKLIDSPAYLFVYVHHIIGKSQPIPSLTTASIEDNKNESHLTRIQLVEIHWIL